MNRCQLGSVRLALLLIIVLGFSLPGCYGSSDGDDEENQAGATNSSAGAGASAGAAPGSSGSTGSGGSAGAAATQTLGEACMASCGNGASCSAPATDCTSTCAAVVAAYSGACADAAAALFECEAELTCAEIEAYAEDYHGSPCGALYGSFAAECGYQPTPPPECSAFCDRAEECAPELTVGGCADNCNAVLGSFESQYGAACASAFVDVYACFGTIDCTAMTALLQSQTLPAACEDESLGASSSCG